MLTSGHFWIGILVGGALVAFVLPMVGVRLGRASAG